MKTHGVMNYQLASALAKMGHGDCILIGDAGCAFPEDGKVTCIDLAVCKDVPKVAEVLEAVLEKLCVEEYILPQEAERTDRLERIVNSHTNTPDKILRPHSEIKQQWLGGPQMRVFVRTGECTPYGYIMLVGGVPF